jgi:hypothetical protein
MKLRSRFAGIAALAVLGLLALAGCQTYGPVWSEVSGVRYHLTVQNRFATLINAVDGANPGPRSGGIRYGYYKLEPGHHTIELQAINTTPNWVSGINRRELTIDIEPCKRYYFGAQFANPLLADWTPVVDYIEPIPGCGRGGPY